MLDLPGRRTAPNGMNTNEATLEQLEMGIEPQLSRCDTKRAAVALNTGGAPPKSDSKNPAGKEDSRNSKKSQFSVTGTKVSYAGSRLTIDRSHRATNRHQNLKHLLSFHNERDFLSTSKADIATSMHVKAQSDAEDEARLVHQIYPIEDQEEWPLEPRKCRFSAMGKRSIAHRYTLKVLAMVIVGMTSFLLALEPSCHEAGHQAELGMIFGLRVIHATCTIMYAILGLPGRMFFSIIKLDDDLEIMDTEQILHYHLRDWRTWLDMVSSLSIIPISFSLSTDGYTPLAWGTLLDLARSWRFMERSSWTSQKSYFGQVAKLVLVLTVLCHFGACVWIVMTVPGQSHTWNQPNWAQKRVPDIHKKGCNELYVASLYFVAKTFTSTGFGDTFPTNADERFMTVILMLIGAMVLAKIVADLTWITETHNHWTAEHFSRMVAMSAALDGLGFSKTLTHRVLAYQQYTKLMAKERAVRRFFDDLSLPLQTELLLAIYHDLVVSATLFAHQPLEVIRLVVGALNDRVYMPMDYIFFIGSDGDELYLVRNGTVSILTGAVGGEELGEPCCQKTVGDHFGEVAVILGTKRLSWAMAQTYVVTAVLHKDVIDDLQVKHPDAFVNLVREVRRTCNLQPTVSLSRVGHLLAERFEDSADAFACIIRAHPNARAIGAIDFVQAMLDLEISRLDALLHWSEVDEDQSGSIDYEEFCKLFTTEEDDEDEEDDDEDANELPPRISTVQAKRTEKEKERKSRMKTWIRADDPGKVTETEDPAAEDDDPSKLRVSIGEADDILESDKSNNQLTANADEKESPKSPANKPGLVSALKKKSLTENSTVESVPSTLRPSQSLKPSKQNHARLSHMAEAEAQENERRASKRQSRSHSKMLNRSSSMKRTPLSELGAALERWRITPKDDDKKRGSGGGKKSAGTGTGKILSEAGEGIESAGGVSKEMFRQEIFKREARAGLKPSANRIHEEVQTLRDQAARIRDVVVMLLEEKEKEKQRSNENLEAAFAQHPSEASSSGTPLQERNPQTGEDVKSEGEVEV